MEKNMKYDVSAGTPLRLGVYRRRTGVNFSLNVRGSEHVEVLLFEPGADKPFQIVPMKDAYKTGLVDAVYIGIPQDVDFEYCYRIDGEEVPDPYARVIKTYPGSDGTEKIRCGVDPGYVNATEPLGLRYRDCVFYKLHVKGFTAEKESGVKHPGTFTGLKEKIPYLKKLGVTTLILMPVYEFRETLPKRKNGIPLLEEAVINKEEERKNYWGYTDGLYYVPKSSYCATDDPVSEFGSLVESLHENGLECVPEFYFDDSMPGWKVVNILHYWRMAFNLDGFRLVGWGDWINAVTSNPILSWSKILYGGYDESRIYPDGKPLICNLAEINQGYQGAMRRFLKGDPDSAEQARWFLGRNNSDISHINYFADHDGFTMYDMVSYSERHNEANGEKNRDGSGENESWNCGTEGETRSRKINQLRARQLRNAFMMLLTGQGSPMIYAGDEFCNSQGGNNNAWCQDNETGHVSWSSRKAAKDLRKFVTEAIEFRKAHPILRMKEPMRMIDYRAIGYPDLSYHGSSAWSTDGRGLKSAFAVMFCGHYAEEEQDKVTDKPADDFIYIAYNMYWAEQDFALPDLPKGMRWKIAADTSYTDSFRRDGEETLLGTAKEKRVLVAPRSVMLLVSVGEPSKKRPGSRRKKA